MNEIFGAENFRNEITIRKSNIQGPITVRFNPAIESLFFYSKTDLARINPQYKERESKRSWIDMHSPKENPRNHQIKIENQLFVAPKGRHWTFSQETVNRLIKEGRIRIVDKEYTDIFGEKHLKIPQYLMSEASIIDSNWTDIPGYSQTQDFATENSEILLKRVIESTSNRGDLVMDFFLGSGTTTAVAHKLGRKWIGVEMGEHFWTVVLPRMKKVLAYDKSGISKEKDVKETYNEKTAGGFFKYQILEQYEDVLDNLELSPNDNYLSLFQDEYLLKYFLTEESKNSPYLLQIEQLSKPFSYKLKVNLKEVGDPQELVIDLPETFNYLLGLNVKRMVMKTMGGDGEAVSEIGGGVATPLNGNKYLFVLGLEQESQQKVAVIWRDWHSKSWKKTDYDADKTFIVESLKEITGENLTLKTVYVNGQSTLTHSDVSGAVVMAIEPEFKRLMESTGVSLP